MLPEIILPKSYSDRIVKLSGDLLAVYGDALHTILLSNRIKTQTDAMRLLDGYDSQMSRRDLIAGLIDEDRAKLSNKVTFGE